MHIKKCRYLFVLTILTGTTIASAQFPIAESPEGMRAFLNAMPKAELHLHIEGTMPPATLVKLANRNGFDFFNTIEDVTASLANRPPGLDGFLSHHNKTVTVIQTKEDFYTITYDFLKAAKENNIVYVEFMFDPQIHTSRDISFRDVITGLDEGRKAAERDFGVKANMILAFNRERSVASAMEALEQAKPYKELITGIGLDSGPEEGNPPTKFKDVYARAKKEGYFLTAHNDVDEKDSVEHIWQALDILKVDRLDHSINSIEDMQLVREINKRGICLTASPVQRRRDPIPQDVERIKFMFYHGMCVSLNTDDPGEFETGYLNEMLFRFQQAGGFSKRDMVRFMRHAFSSAWLPDEEKNAYIEALKAWAAPNGVRL